MLKLDELIACFEMCILQQDTSPESICGMIEAFQKAKDYVRFPNTRNAFDLFVLHIADVIDGANRKGLRSTPIYFRQTMQSVPPPNNDAFKKLMEICFEFISGKVRLASESDANAADRLYYEFQNMHPFEDGNGRVGWLIWLMLKYAETGQWTSEFPPDFFGKNHVEVPRPIFSSDFVK